MKSFFKQIDWFLGQLVQKIKHSFGIPLFFAVIGSFGCYAIIRIGLETYRINSWPGIECKIIESKLTPHRVKKTGEDDYLFEVRYSYAFEGAGYESNLLNRHGDNYLYDYGRATQLLSKYPPGNTVECFANPEKPGYAVLERGRNDYIVLAFLPIPLILSLIGICYLLGIWLFYWDEVTLSGDTLGGTVALATVFLVIIAVHSGFWTAFSIAFLGYIALVVPKALFENVKKETGQGKQELLKYQMPDTPQNVGEVPVIADKTETGRRIVFSNTEKIIIGTAAVVFVVIETLWIRSIAGKISRDGLEFGQLFGLFFTFVWSLGVVGTITYGIIVNKRRWIAEKAKPLGEKKAAGAKRIDISEIVRDLSIWTLVGSNIFVLVWAVIEKQSLIEIMWVYWFQSVGIGVIWFLRLWTVRNVYVEKDFHSLGDPSSTLGRKFNALFLIVHYGLFHAVYMAFLAGENGKINFNPIYVMALVFFAEQLFSFIYHKDWESAKPVKYGKLVFMPYLRIVPMHLTIIGSAILKDKLGINFEHTAVLVLFLVFKTFADVGMYVSMRQGITYTGKSGLRVYS